MLADKDIDGVIAALRARVDRWFVARLPGPRGASRRRRCATALLAAGVDGDGDHAHSTTSNALTRARDVAAGEADRIVVFGSFLTVAAALALGRPAVHPSQRR